MYMFWITRWNWPEHKDNSYTIVLVIHVRMYNQDHEYYEIFTVKNLLESPFLVIWC